jgi:hypothetical protein
MLEYLPGGDLKHFLINKKEKKKLDGSDYSLESGLSEDEVILIMS